MAKWKVTKSKSWENRKTIYPTKKGKTMTTQHTDEMREVDIDKALAEWRSTLTTSLEVLIGFQPRQAFHAGYSAAATRYEDALREAQEAIMQPKSYHYVTEDGQKHTVCQRRTDKEEKVLAMITSLIGEKK